MGYTSDIVKADRIDEDLEFPSVILIDNCNACNLRCSMCDHPNMHKHRHVQLMEMGLYEKIIDEIAREKPDARIWEIFFGDPFMCGDMPRRIQYAKDKGLTDVVLNSNGVRMVKRRSEPLVKAGLDSMYVGIDAAKKETYDKIRIGGDFQKAVKNVLDYRDLLLQCGNGQQKIFVQFVVSEFNENEVEAFRKFWGAEGVNVKIRPKVSWAGLVDAVNLQDNSSIERKPCYWLMKTINICADGMVSFCSVDVHCRVNSGDVNKVSVKDVWLDKLKEYRAMHRECRYHELPDLCRNCRDWQSAYAEFY